MIFVKPPDFGPCLSKRISIEGLCEAAKFRPVPSVRINVVRQDRYPSSEC